MQLKISSHSIAIIVALTGTVFLIYGYHQLNKTVSTEEEKKEEKKEEKNEEVKKRS